MPELSPIKWKKFEKFLLYIGCVFKRQKGDHRIYWRKDLIRPIVLPKYDNLPKFIILNNLRTLGITVKEYLEILKRI